MGTIIVPDANFVLQRVPAFTSVVANNQGSAFQLIVPAGYYLVVLGLFSRNANILTGGLKCGTSAGATDVIAAQAITAAGIVNVFDSAILKRYYSPVNPVTLFFDAVTAWNGAFIDVGLLVVNVVGG